MRKSHTFAPALSDTLEIRDVPSTFANILTHGALTTQPVIHAPNTFDNGVPSVHVATNGERFSTGATVRATTVKAAAATTTVRPAAVTTNTVVTPPVVVHLPGTFDYGNGLPTVHVATNGERFTLGRSGR